MEYMAGGFFHTFVLFNKNILKVRFCLQSCVCYNQVIISAVPKGNNQKLLFWAYNANIEYQYPSTEAEYTYSVLYKL